MGQAMRQVDPENELQQRHSLLPSHRRDIELRAYELYCERGRVAGHEIADWLQAERETAERLDRLLLEQVLRSRLTGGRRER